MTCPPACLPPKGQLFTFPGTGGPLLLLGEGQVTRRQYINRCGPPCVAPRVPQGTVVFFAPPKVPPPYRPPMPPSPPPPAPPVMYGNTQQECTNTCPEGTNGAPITVTVTSGIFERSEQAAADAAALASACAQADALRAATPCTVEGEMVVTMVSDYRECSLCGFDAFLFNAVPPVVSVPPVKYLTCTFAGSYHGDVYNVVNTWNTVPYSCLAEDGAFPQGFFDVTYSGSSVFNPLTCAQSSTAVQGISENGGATNFVPINAPIYGPAFEADCITTTTRTSTQSIRVKSGNCCGVQATEGGMPALSQVQVGGYTETFSDPDTDENAIIRATPVLGTENVAKYQARTNGFDFIYQTVAIDFDLTTLVTGVNYRITLPLTTEFYDGTGAVESETFYDFVAPGPTHNIADLIVAPYAMKVTIGTAILSVI